MKLFMLIHATAINEPKTAMVRTNKIPEANRILWVLLLDIFDILHLVLGFNDDVGVGKLEQTNLCQFVDVIAFSNHSNTLK